MARKALLQLVARLEARSNAPWLRWLEAAPPSVREAERLTRHALVVYQLPWVVASAVVFNIAKHLGLLASRPFIGLCLLLPGVVAVLWPVYILRLALVARQSVSSSTPAIALRLRIYAIINFAFASLMGGVIAGFVGLVVFVAVSELARAA